MLAAGFYFIKMFLAYSQRLLASVPSKKGRYFAVVVCKAFYRALPHDRVNFSFIVYSCLLRHVRLAGI